jgi:hypothetical protein
VATRASASSAAPSRETSSSRSASDGSRGVDRLDQRRAPGQQRDQRGRRVGRDVATGARIANVIAAHVRGLGLKRQAFAQQRDHPLAERVRIGGARRVEIGCACRKADQDGYESDPHGRELCQRPPASIY